MSINQALILCIKNEKLAKRMWPSNICREWYKIQNNKKPYMFYDDNNDCVTVEIENEDSTC